MLLINESILRLVSLEQMILNAGKMVTTSWDRLIDLLAASPPRLLLASRPKSNSRTV